MVDYSKWDRIELSDDSDIECHPNVDKRSLIKWKQEQIHREREERRRKISELKKRTEEQKEELDNIESINEKLKGNEPAPDSEQGIYYGKMRQRHVELKRLYAEANAELKKLEEIEDKKLTSDKTKTVIDRTAVTKPIQPPNETSKPAKKTEKTRVYETLNPGSKDGVPASKQPPPTTTAQSEDSEDSSDEDVQVSSAAAEFSKIRDFDKSLQFISKHPYLATQKYSDEIMAQAFKAQMDGKELYANNCVHQALVLQYCAQLGRDGVGLFFNRIRDPRHQALKIFNNDWKETYERIKKRCVVIAQERANNPSHGVETIQLQATDPNTQIHITGPPPDADPQVHEIFQALPQAFQEAILSGSLDNVNKALEGMSVELAEEVVRICNQVGFLSIEGDIIDTTIGETIPGQEKVSDSNGAVTETMATTEDDTKENEEK